MANNIKHISGPINTIRVEGEINGKPKILYMFMDWHLDPYWQTECDDIRASEFKRYLIQNFDKLTGSDRMVDFFLEIYVKVELFDKYYGHDRYKKKYILNIRKFFKKIFAFDFKKKQVQLSNEFPNVRLHYIDFRDLFMNDLYWNKFSNMSNFFKTNCWDAINLTTWHISEIKKLTKPIDDQIKKLHQLIYKSKKIKKTQNMFLKIINKILYVYQNKNVQKIIVNYINNDVKKEFQKYFVAHKKLFDYMDHISEFLYDANIRNNNNNYGVDYDTLISKYLPTIHKILSDLGDAIVYIGVGIVDVYFLRRFLDKDYISNAVVYTGSAHSTQYLYVLVKYFNFKITHYSFLSESPKIIEKKIKASKNMKDIRKFTYPLELYQCSDLTNFPHEFI